MKKTFLYDQHLKLNAKMVEFSGYSMPLEYQGIIQEHLATRNDCGVFDVSHMGEILITGPDARKCTNYLFSGKIPSMPQMSYGFLLNKDGGIIDDLMIYYFNEQKIMFVVNASNLNKDFVWIKNNCASFQVNIENISDSISQLAVQGPNAERVLKRLIDNNISTLKMFQFQYYSYMENELLISRSGYTGEDGFEIYGSGEVILKLFKELINSGITPCGLGARDTLRFQAAMPLYGNEINEKINPLEAGLKFGVDFSKDFIGRKALDIIQKKGLKRKLVGLKLLSRGIARSGYEVEKDGKVIGFITTGYLIPGLNEAYAFAFLDKGYWNLETIVNIKIRKRLVPAIVCNKNFFQKKYKK